jgi:hypothetical protein
VVAFHENHVFAIPIASMKIFLTISLSYLTLFLLAASVPAAESPTAATKAGLRKGSGCINQGLMWRLLVKEAEGPQRPDEYAGPFYSVMARGNRRAAIFVG